LHSSHALNDLFSVSSLTIPVLEEEAQCGSQHTVSFQETSAEILLLTPLSFNFLGPSFKTLSEDFLEGRNFFPFFFSERWLCNLEMLLLKYFMI